ncbi:MAG: hypothetical protein LBR33_07130 [Propionibacteriaceae bacterium]|jgi:hypothetical protein|nr:hypothetical protein [Propionibacteriaceae bacterium]
MPQTPARRPLRLLGAATLALIALAGCGQAPVTTADSPSPTAAATTTTPPATTPAAPATTAAAPVTTTPAAPASTAPAAAPTTEAAAGTAFPPAVVDTAALAATYTADATISDPSGQFHCGYTAPNSSYADGFLRCTATFTDTAAVAAIQAQYGQDPCNQNPEAGVVPVQGFMLVGAAAGFACPHDATPGDDVLAAGSTVQFGSAYQCTALSDGLTCRSLLGNGAVWLRPGDWQITGLA